jgi:hypothetical protein
MASRNVRRFGFVLFGLLIAAGSAGCDIAFAPAVIGNGVAKSESREVGRFSEIDVSSAIQVNVKVGPETKLVVTADENILPLVKTDVMGSRLTIYMDGSCSSDLGVRVEGTVAELDAFSGSGASTSTLEGIAGERFKLELSGASHCKLDGNVEAMDALLSGASRATIVGATKRLQIECSGASHVNATELVAESVSTELSGASTADVNASKELYAEASGASTLRYGGKPARVQKDVSGASTIGPK